jgi:flavodoxin
MRAHVVSESMYGNTHVVADHIADRLRPLFDVGVGSPARRDPSASRAAASLSAEAGRRRRLPVSLVT